MGQVLRITYNNTDYNYQILNTTPIGKETEEIEILLEETTYTLVCVQGQWVSKETHEFRLSELLASIGRALSLRYRI